MMFYIRNTFCSKPKDDISRHLKVCMHSYFTVKPGKIKFNNFVFRYGFQNCQIDS